MDPSPDKDDPEKRPPKRDLVDFDPAERDFWENADDEEAEEERPGEEPELEEQLEDLDEGDQFEEEWEDL
ncbi:MAG: hypothetical protein GWO24_27480, partial [Akkermansiaceae bacterium]|nr:hypothetical protein [Akkermansiaceae bacterium]